MTTQFGTELHRRRQLSRLSRSRLAWLSGVSEAQIRNLEHRNVTPQRTTVIDLAAALDWDVDEALAMTGQDPLSTDEWTYLPRRKRDLDPQKIVSQILPTLTPVQQWAIAVTAQAMADPHRWPADNPGGGTNPGHHDGQPTHPEVTNPGDDCGGVTYLGTRVVGTDPEPAHEPSADERTANPNGADLNQEGPGSKTTP